MEVEGCERQQREPSGKDLVCFHKFISNENSLRRTETVETAGMIRPTRIAETGRAFRADDRRAGRV